MLSRSLRVIKPSIQSVRLFSTSKITLQHNKVDSKTASNLSEVTGPDSSLIGPGAKPGTIPTNEDQATGLERFEMLGKLEGIDVWDMENPIKEGTGHPTDPFLVPSYLGERIVGCKGKGDEDHKPYWMNVSEDKPGRCWHCGNVFAIKYLGSPEHHHH